MMHLALLMDMMVLVLMPTMFSLWWLRKRLVCSLVGMFKVSGVLAGIVFLSIIWLRRSRISCILLGMNRLLTRKWCCSLLACTAVMRLGV